MLVCIDSAGLLRQSHCKSIIYLRRQIEQDKSRANLFLLKQFVNTYWEAENQGRVELALAVTWIQLVKGKLHFNLLCLSKTSLKADVWQVVMLIPCHFFRTVLFLSKPTLHPTEDLLSLELLWCFFHHPGCWGQVSAAAPNTAPDSFLGIGEATYSWTRHLQHQL